MTQPSNKTPSPRRAGWPYMVGAVLTLAIQQGWNPSDVRQLATAVLILVALIYSAQHRDRT